MRGAVVVTQAQGDVAQIKTAALKVVRNHILDFSISFYFLMCIFTEVFYTYRMQMHSEECANRLDVGCEIRDKEFSTQVLAWGGGQRRRRPPPHSSQSRGSDVEWAWMPL